MTRKKWMILLLVLMMAFALFGCRSTKDKTRKETDRTVTETERTITQRKGDTVTYIVPNVKFKDTVITTTNRVTGTTQILRYDDEGRLTAAECVAGFIDVITESNRQVIEAINESNKQKEESISPMIMFYFMGGIVVMFTIALVFIWLQIKKMKLLIPAI